MKPIAVILLAAGSSSRMGRSKQLLEINGQPLLNHSANAALGSTADYVLVVLGSNHQAHQKIIESLPLVSTYNPSWELGMGNSIKAGLQHVLTHDPLTQAVIIIVCDQPGLTASHLQRLIKQYREKESKIVASSYAKITGVPALFDRSLFPELLALRDDQGARPILNTHSNSNSMITVDFAGGEIDLDTPHDYQTFIQKSS